MSPGRFARRLLGERYARMAGRAYRRIFVDLDKAYAVIADQIPRNANVLDVGGGDGEPLNRLLALRADIRITTIDVAAGVGSWIRPEYLDRVKRVPSITLPDYVDAGYPTPDVVLVADVVHHIPSGERQAFFDATARLLLERPARLIVKDVEPGHWRATLGLLSDHYVTGDRSVCLVSRDELIDRMRRALPSVSFMETSLHEVDPPNYALVFTVGTS